MCNQFNDPMVARAQRWQFLSGLAGSRYQKVGNELRRRRPIKADLSTVHAANRVDQDSGRLVSEDKATSAQTKDFR